ncbi:phosphoesterase [Leptospira fletcheri]|uniref:Phosphoesterase n=1 Tax=Leptospira fletcheri TaxID=2484981 RepID=A0A4R9GC53_9LEPT|nr:phosphoesterase [Leptospira fletcheri]TGK08730.1 phosphoesterase [Leptospira fletcheri]
MWKRVLIYFLPVLPLFFFGWIVWAILFLRSPLKMKPHGEWNKGELSNPYAASKKKKWTKAAIHLHTNQAWFTPLRNSPEEVAEVYANHGYELLAFTDYEKITRVPSGKIAGLSGYEWGRNFRKRHMTVLGSREVDHDMFPLYSSPENIQWEIDLQNRKGNFVTINHPSLYDSFPLPFLEKLSGYNAIEVLSPFGDILEYWDRLLSLGVSSFCMASDDLHYLPKEEYLKVTKDSFPSLREFATKMSDQDGESLMRYVLINSDSLEEKDILSSLKAGNYACVRKMDRVLADPKLKVFGIRNGKEVYYEFEDLPLTVDFIGKNGKLLSRSYGQKKGSYRFQPEDLYVRIQIVFPTAVVLSNPFYQK